VNLQYDTGDPRFGWITIAGNTRSRDLILTSSRYPDCAYALADSNPSSTAPAKSELSDGTVRVSQISACQQTIAYAIVPPSAVVPLEFRVFSGVWLGAWHGDLCSVLIVEQVKPNGAVSTIYAIGSNGIDRMMRRRWDGVIADGRPSLRDSGGNAFVDYKAINANELSGAYNNAFGTFKRQ
jgi:hypothetical protein